MEDQKNDVDEVKNSDEKEINPDENKLYIILFKHDKNHPWRVFDHCNKDLKVVKARLDRAHRPKHIKTFLLEPDKK